MLPLHIVHAIVDGKSDPSDDVYLHSALRTDNNQYHQQVSIFASITPNARKKGYFDTLVRRKMYIFHGQVDIVALTPGALYVDALGTCAPCLRGTLFRPK